MPFHSTEFQHLWGPPPNSPVSSAPIYILSPYSTPISLWSSFYLETQLFLSTFLGGDTRCVLRNHGRHWWGSRADLGTKVGRLTKGSSLLRCPSPIATLFQKGCWVGLKESMWERIPRTGPINQEWEEVRSVQGSQEPVNSHSQRSQRNSYLWSPSQPLNKSYLF